MLFKDADDAGENQKGASEPVDFVGDYRVDLAGLDVGQEARESGPVHVAPGKAAVVITSRQTLPALVALALDVGQGGFALRIERVEVLFKTLLGGFAGVNGAPDRSRHIAFCGHARPPLTARQPRKKRKPLV